MKEINILCVEDGSVDVESLENEGLHDGKVIIYRQGANPPFVLKLKTDDGDLKSEQNKVAVEKLEELKLKLRKLEFQQISTFEKAQKEMNTQIKNFEENTGTEYNQKNTGKNYYSVYNENNYNEDHFEMLIQGKEIL